MFNFIFDPLQNLSDKYGKIVPISIFIVYALITIPLILFLESRNISPVISGILSFFLFAFLITGGFGTYKKG
jgi:ABC-type transport system involved in cytochrome c biogenesis permease subunit